MSVQDKNPPTLTTVEPSPEQLDCAAARWVTDRDREFDVCDFRYFKNNWRFLPGLRNAVEEECARGKSPASTTDALPLEYKLINGVARSLVDVNVFYNVYGERGGMVDAAGLNPAAEVHAGSSPAARTSGGEHA